MEMWLRISSFASCLVNSLPMDPISVYQNSTMNIRNILTDICPPFSKIAMVAAGGCALFPIYFRQSKVSEVAYFGGKREVVKFRQMLDKRGG